MNLTLRVGKQRGSNEGEGLMPKCNCPDHYPVFCAALQNDWSRGEATQEPCECECHKFLTVGVKVKTFGTATMGPAVKSNENANLGAKMPEMGPTEQADRAKEEKDD